MTLKPVRVGLLLDGMAVSKGEYLSLKRALDEQPIELTTVGLNDSQRNRASSKGGGNSNPAIRFIQEISSNRPHVLVDADFHIGRFLGEESVQVLDNKWWKRTSVEQLLNDHGANILRYNPIEIDNGTRYEIPTEVVDAFADSCDVIINFEHLILDGDIFDATEYGVLSHHSSDIRKYRGRPSCVWQYINNESTIGRTLQQLTPVLDGGRPVIIKEAEIKETDTIWDVRRKSNELQPPLHSEAIEQIVEDKFDPRELDELGELTHSSDKQRWQIVVRILLKNWKARLKKTVA